MILYLYSEKSLATCHWIAILHVIFMLCRPSGISHSLVGVSVCVSVACMLRVGVFVWIRCCLCTVLFDLFEEKYVDGYIWLSMRRPTWAQWESMAVDRMQIMPGRVPDQELQVRHLKFDQVALVSLFYLNLIRQLLDTHVVDAAMQLNRGRPCSALLRLQHSVSEFRTETFPRPPRTASLTFEILQNLIPCC